MKQTSDKQAFTLAEVIITSFLLMIISIPISRMAYMSIYSSRYARDMGTAVSIGQEKLESFSNTSYTYIVSGTSTQNGMDLAWTVTPVNGTKIVNLTISWEIVSDPKSINLNAIYVED